MKEKKEFDVSGIISDVNALLREAESNRRIIDVHKRQRYALLAACLEHEEYTKPSNGLHHILRERILLKHEKNTENEE